MKKEEYVSENVSEEDLEMMNETFNDILLHHKKFVDTKKDYEQKLAEMSESDRQKLLYGEWKNEWYKI